MKSISRYIDPCLCLALGGLSAILYYPVLESYWLFEELQVLRHAHQYSPWEYFFAPRVWREVSVANLMPWLSLSLDADLFLFGFQHVWFYLHHLISLWGVSALIFLVLRLWISRPLSFLGAALFLVSAPAAAAAEMLMVRHYVEGAVLALLSLYLFVTALRRESLALSVLSAFVYLFAMSAKEVYVPLSFVVLFLPEGTVRARLRHAFPLFCSLLFYVFWRLLMLGSFGGGYHNTFLPPGLNTEAWRTILKNIAESIRMLDGGSMMRPRLAQFSLISAAISLLLAFFSEARGRRVSRLLFLPPLFLAVYLPIAPLFNHFHADDFLSYRFMFLVSIFYSIVLPLVLAVLYLPHDKSLLKKDFNARRWIVVVVGLVVLLSVSLNSQYWIRSVRKSFLRPLSVEGKFIMNADELNLVIKSSVPPGNNYYENLEYFRVLTRRPPIPDVVNNTYVHLDDEKFYDSKGIRVYKFDTGKNGMAEITDGYLRERKEFFSRIRRLPFAVDLKITGGGIYFLLGPSDSGRYFVLAGYRPNVYCTAINVSRQFGQKLYSSLKTYIRFGWESPEGWVTFSPEWLVDLSKEQNLRWTGDTAR